MANVLITGASSGIGAATALHLDSRGVRVFAGVLSLQEGASALAGASERLRQVSLDVTDEASIRQAMDSIRGEVAGAGLDGLVNNAGEGIAGPLEVVPFDQLREQLEVNVLGQIAVTRAALPLIRQATGRIVFVGSVGGRLAVEFAGAYHASKYAIEAIGDAWRQELDPEGIRVSIVEPSAISTAIWDKAVARLDDLLAGSDPELDRYRDRLRSFRDSLTSADEKGLPPEDVATAIEQALTDEHPGTRYVVGASGKLATALKPFIPDRLADKLAERAAKH